MSETRRNLWVGSFALFGLLAVGALVVMFGKMPSWIASGKAYELRIDFDFVSGVREGTLVTMGGKTIGRVTGVDFKNPERIDLGITVVTVIDGVYRLPENCRAVTNEAIMGMGRPSIRIVVDVASDRYLEPKQSILGRTTPAIETIFPPTVVDTLQTSATQIGEAAGALKPVLHDLHEILVKRDVSEVDALGGQSGNLSTVVARLDSMVKHFNEVFGDPAVQSQVREGIANLHKMSEDLQLAVAQFNEFAKEARAVAAEAKLLTGKASQTLDSLDANMQRLTRAATTDLEKLSVFLDGLAVVALKIKRGEGTLGKFVQDERLFESMVLTFKRMTETLDEFKKLVDDVRSGKVKIRVGL